MSSWCEQPMWKFPGKSRYHYVVHSPSKKILIFFILQLGLSRAQILFKHNLTHRFFLCPIYPLLIKLPSYPSNSLLNFLSIIELFYDINFSIEHDHQVIILTYYLNGLSLLKLLLTIFLSFLIGAILFAINFDTYWSLKRASLNLLHSPKTTPLILENFKLNQLTNEAFPFIIFWAFRLPL